MLFPVKTALSYIPGSIFGGGRGDQGENFFTAPNPPVGAIITYNLKDGYRTKAQERQQRERAAIQRGETPPYPTPGQLRAESEEEAPAILMTITDAAGKVVRRMDDLLPPVSIASPGICAGRALIFPLPHSAAAVEEVAAARRRGWRGRVVAGPRGGGGEEEPPAFAGRGAAERLVVPGKYTVALAKRIDGVVTPLPGSQSFEVIGEGPSTREDRAALSEFEAKLARLQQALTATQELPPRRARVWKPSAARWMPRLRFRLSCMNKRSRSKSNWTISTSRCAAIRSGARTMKAYPHPSPSV